VRITTIYEGTSEIMEMTIARDRWQQHLKTRGAHYHDLAAAQKALAADRPEVGAQTAALALHALAEILELARVGRLTRSQHVLLRFGELIAYAECAAALTRRAGRCGRGAAGQGRPALRRGRAGRDQPRLRQGGRAEGRRGGAALGPWGQRTRRRPVRPRGGAAARPRCARHRQVCWPTWTPSPTPPTDGADRARRGRGAPAMDEDTARRAVAIVGMSAIMPEAPDAAAFWENIAKARYSITDVPPERWDPALYYDPDPAAVDKTYSKIGGWVREFEWNPLAWRLPIPPKVGEQMDDGQQWAINLTRAALMDAGWPQRPIDGERTAVILGNALAGEKHYETYMRICFPEVVRELRSSPTFATLPSEVKEQIIAEAQERWRALSAPITEDTMPGELANVIAGRVANLFDFRGPNYVTDAACASGMAAMNAAVEGLVAGQYDAAITGGIDRNMGVAAFVKFCKIGALSATGTRPYADGADGFVMGEGGAVFLLKRLADAERDGDRVYAVIRGMAGSSDGKGKGITAPNPAGQRLAVERAWRNAGIDPSTASLVEGHGTSTRVGDVVEVEALQSVFGAGGARPGSIPLGSVKSNIGHLKGAAGAAGVFKVAMALAEKVLPPSVGATRRTRTIDWASSVLTVNTELRDWAAAERRPLGGRQRVRVRRDELPHRAGGARARSAVGERLTGARRRGGAAAACCDRRGAVPQGAAARRTCHRRRHVGGDRRPARRPHARPRGPAASPPRRRRIPRWPVLRCAWRSTTATPTSSPPRPRRRPPPRAATTQPCGRCCVRRGCSSAPARRRRSRSSTRGRARST
jgi:3-oxoacyl-(acyl-carrier-protein) synthase